MPIDPDEYRRLYAEQQHAAADMMREAARRGREFMVFRWTASLGIRDHNERLASAGLARTHVAPSGW